MSMALAYDSSALVLLLLLPDGQVLIFLSRVEVYGPGVVPDKVIRSLLDTLVLDQYLRIDHLGGDRALEERCIAGVFVPAVIRVLLCLVCKLFLLFKVLSDDFSLVRHTALDHDRVLHKVTCYLADQVLGYL